MHSRVIVPFIPHIKFARTPHNIRLEAAAPSRRRIQSHNSCISLALPIDSRVTMDDLPDLDWRIARATALALAVEQDDLISLRKWSAEPGGFGTNEIRKKVW